MTATDLPEDRLLRLAQQQLKQHLPNHDAAIAAPENRPIIENFATEALMYHGLSDFHFWRMDPREQEIIISGIEELIFEGLDAGIWPFYAKKLVAGHRPHWQRGNILAEADANMATLGC